MCVNEQVEPIVAVVAAKILEQALMEARARLLRLVLAWLGCAALVGGAAARVGGGD
jgi:hypothetical protein